MMAKINLIPHDLRRGEMILQIADLLTSLEKSSQEIFARIDSRVNELNGEIQTIGHRAENARSQVNRLREFKNRGVRIYSSGKYPSKQELNIPDYKPIGETATAHLHDLESTKRTIRGIHIPFSEEVLVEKLQFYQYQSRTRSSNPIPDDQTPVIPWHRLTNVGSLVRFNSSQNPFLTRGKSGSGIEQKAKKKHHLDEDQVDATQAAPASMTKLDEEDEDSFFRINSELDAAPTLIDELPAALPDLDGIASDMFFEPMDQTLSSSNMFFAEPVVAANKSSKANSRATVKNTNVVKAVKKVSINAPSSSNENSFEAPQKAIPAPPVMPAIQPPPPPPPPTVAPETKPSSTPLPSVDGGRASLLESIRNAAGKPKKGQVTAKDLKIEKKKQKQAEKAVSGDLMGDLMASLRARRIGISGSKDQTPRTSTPLPTSGRIEPDSALHRVSTMIPPPLPSTADQPEDSDQEDWD